MTSTDLNSSSELSPETPPPLSPYHQNDDWSSGELLLALVLGGITLVTIFGNLLLLYLFVKSKRALRSPTHRLIASLGFADLLVGIGVNPLLITLTFNDWKWNFGESACHLAQHGHFWLCATSLLSMMTISIERYLGVRFPLRHKRILTKSRVITVIILIWSMGLALTSIPLWIWPSIGGEVGYCKVNLRPQFALFLSLSLFFIPQTITAITHWQTYRHAVKLYDPEGLTKSKQFLDVNSCQSNNSNWGGSNKSDHAFASSSVRSKQKVSEKERYLDMKAKQTQLAKKLGITVGIMIVLYAPLFTLFLIAGVAPNLVTGKTMLIVAWIRYISCAVNPFLYILIVPGYKKAFFRAIWNEISVLDSDESSSSKSGSMNGSTRKMIRKKSQRVGSSSAGSSSISTSRSYSDYPSTSETVTNGSGPTYVNVNKNKHGGSSYQKNRNNLGSVDLIFGDNKKHPECSNCGLLMTNDLKGDEELQICAICNIRYNSRLQSFTDVKHLKIVSRPSIEEKVEQSSSITTAAIVSSSRSTGGKRVTRGRNRSDVTSGSLVYELRSFLKDMEKKRIVVSSEDKTNGHQEKSEEELAFEDRASELISNIIKIMPAEVEGIIKKEESNNFGTTTTIEDKDIGYCKIDKLRRSIVRPISYRRSQILSSINSSKKDEKADKSGDMEELKELDDILEIIERELVSFEQLNT